jgi:hypothetical protein
VDTLIPATFFASQLGNADMRIGIRARNITPNLPIISSEQPPIFNITPVATNRDTPNRFTTTDTSLPVDISTVGNPDFTNYVTLAAYITPTNTDWTFNMAVDKFDFVLHHLDLTNALTNDGVDVHVNITYINGATGI